MAALVKASLDYFIGREKLVKELTGALKNYKRPFFLVHGPAGVGKTSLVHAVIGENPKLFGSIEWMDGPRELRQIFPDGSGGVDGKRWLRPLPGPDSLLVIDDVEDVDYADSTLSRLSYGPHYRAIILISRRHLKLRYVNYTLEVPPVALSDWIATATRVMGERNGELFATMLAQEDIKDIPATAFPYLLKSFEKWGADAIGDMLRPIDSSGLFGADGKPVMLGKRAPIITEASNVEKELIKAVHKRPELIHELTPRRFEEFVAELMRQQGFTVTLTPATRDGGKDIYLAAKSNLGSFLYLVECKQYKTKPVGIAPVQRLYGVLEGEKATAGLLVTTSTFTKPAEQFQEKVSYRLSLVDFLKLNKMIADVSTAGTRVQ